MKTLALDPLNVKPVYDEYKQILLNMYHLVGKLRRAQGFEQVKTGLKKDIEGKRTLLKRLVDTMEEVDRQIATL